MSEREKEHKAGQKNTRQKVKKNYNELGNEENRNKIIAKKMEVIFAETTVSFWEF